MRKAAIWASVTSWLSGVRSTMARMKALDLGVGEGEAVALVEDDVDGVDGCVRSFLGFREEGCGEEVGDGGLGDGAVFGGEEDVVSGVLNSWMVWRQAPQGWLAVLLRLAMTMARMRMVGPWWLTAAAMADCSAQVVRR